MKIFTSRQIRELDDSTIRHEPVSSADLMERAANKLFEWFVNRYGNSHPVYVFAGPGNNGGDGLALARMLSGCNCLPEVICIDVPGNRSKDWELNMKRLKNETTVKSCSISDIGQFPEIPAGSVIVDAIFGSGLSRSADGLAAKVINKINRSGVDIVSIDIPSGLFGEDNGLNDHECIIHATFTLSFQFPKLSFMFPENEIYTGKWIVLPIDLDAEAIENTITPWNLVEGTQVKTMLKVRNRFDHKGTFGHGLFIGGTFGKMGAAILSSRAALHAGIGLLTCHIPSGSDMLMQVGLPEAMVSHDRSEDFISEVPDTGRYNAVGVGPGIGIAKETQSAVRSLLLECKKPMVIDADALNILAENKEWLGYMQPGTILTPHPKEFERLAGKTGNGYERLLRQTKFSSEHSCIVVLKGASTSISSPDGNVWFNSTGNPGMATAGSGDVLTGIILSLLAQGYKPVNAAITGVYLHGLAGDIAAGKSSQESVIASDIINEIGSAFNTVRNYKIH